MKGSVFTCVILYALFVYEGCDVVSSFSSKALSSRFALRPTGLPFVSNNKLNQASACSGARRKTAWFLKASNSAIDAPKDDALSEIFYKREDFTKEMILKIQDDLPKVERFRKDLEDFIDTPEGIEDQKPLSKLLTIAEIYEEQLRAAYDKVVESVQGYPNFWIKNHTVTYLRGTITQDFYEAISDDLTELEVLEKDVLYYLHLYPLDDTLKEVRAKLEDKLKVLRAAYDKVVESVQGHPNFWMKNHTVTYLRENITADFYKTISNDLTKLEIFENDILFHLHCFPLDDTLKEVRAVVRSKLEELRKTQVYARRALDSRIAPVNYRIDSRMIYRYDYNLFKKCVENLFNWWNEKHEYMAPCLSMVQSSGSGKTKLLVQYKQDNKEMAVLILCVPQSLEQGDPLLNTFDATLLAPPVTPFKDADRENLRAQLDSIVRKVKGNRVVLLFDEAQFLLSHDETKEDRGFYYRVVRWWLRENEFTKLKKQIVAVFTGTSSRLANYFKEDPKETLFSRDPQETYNQGTMLYEPFYQLSTIGLAKYDAPIEQEGITDFDRAAYYGRPLFARLAAGNRLGNKTLDAIRKRMLMHDDDLTSLSDTGCLSVLGTRVQMGIASFQTASTLVARGYASLTFASARNLNFATMTFFPDPVPAYLAMTLMIRNEDMAVVDAHEPSFWTAKASELVSTGLCFPDKGDIGEIASALYFLFCGDVLRLAIDRSLKTFAVPLSHFLRLAIEPKNVSALDTHSLLEASSSASVKFIQVCRNYERYSLKDLIAMGYLEQWYTAGLALYNVPNGRIYDIIAPVRVGEGTDSKYYPMIISVKNHEVYAFNNLQGEKDRMTELFRNETVESGVCVLVVPGLGAEQNRTFFDTCASVQEKLEAWNGKGVLCLSIAIPPDDCFGCWKLAREPSTAGGREAEAFSSHFMVHQSSGTLEDADAAMRAMNGKRKVKRTSTPKVPKSPKAPKLPKVPKSPKEPKPKSPKEPKPKPPKEPEPPEEPKPPKESKPKPPKESKPKPPKESKPKPPKESKPKPPKESKPKPPKESKPKTT